MRNAAKKSEHMGLEPVDIYYQSIEFDEEQLPEILDWKVGEVYTITMKVMQRAAFLTHDETNKADFDILEVGGE